MESQSFLGSGKNLLFRETHGRLDLVHGPVVARQSARLSEALVAQVALEGPHVVVAPEVHDQARALLEHHLAVVVVAHEVGLDRVVVRAHRLESLVRARRHRLQSGVRLPLGNVLPA